jgi:hypothetical protein
LYKKFVDDQYYVVLCGFRGWLKVQVGLLKSGTLGTRPEPDQKAFRTMSGQNITVPKHLNNPYLGVNNKKSTTQNTDIHSVPRQVDVNKQRRTMGM